MEGEESLESQENAISREEIQRVSGERGVWRGSLEGRYISQEEEGREELKFSLFSCLFLGTHSYRFRSVSLQSGNIVSVAYVVFFYGRFLRRIFSVRSTSDQCGGGWESLLPFLPHSSWRCKLGEL